MVPFLYFFMLTGVGGAANKWIALIIFCGKSCRYTVDGKIARARNLVTNSEGCQILLEWLLLVCSAMICIVPLGKLQAWFVIVIIAREFIIQRIPSGSSRQRYCDCCKLLGKFKLLSQMFVLILLMPDLGVALT